MHDPYIQTAQRQGAQYFKRGQQYSKDVAAEFYDGAFFGAGIRIRLMLEATLERMRQAIKVDISTDDVITPSAVEYAYKLMFEDRTISLLTYNLETLLAEKMQTIIVRGIANTRLRDFYDVYEITKIHATGIDKALLQKAFLATCKKRGTIFSKEEISETLAIIEKNAGMAQMWELFQKKNYFVGDLTWNDVFGDVLKVFYTYVVDI